MPHLVKINLCMGSSCFARGNSQLLDELERAVEANGWRHKVHIVGSRCENRCGSGPNVSIDGEPYAGADVGVILDIVGARLEAASERL